MKSVPLVFSLSDRLQSAKIVGDALLVPDRESSRKGAHPLMDRSALSAKHRTAGTIQIDVGARGCV